MGRIERKEGEKIDPVGSPDNIMSPPDATDSTNGQAA